MSSIQSNERYRATAAGVDVLEDDSSVDRAEQHVAEPAHQQEGHELAQCPGHVPHLSEPPAFPFFELAQVGIAYRSAARGRLAEQGRRTAICTRNETEWRRWCASQSDGAGRG